MESVSKIRLWILQVGRSIRSVAHDTGVGEVDFLITRMIDAKLSFDRDLLSSAETDVGHKAAKKLAVMIACSTQEQAYMKAPMSHPDSSMHRRDWLSRSRADFLLHERGVIAGKLFIQDTDLTTG